MNGGLSCERGREKMGAEKGEMRLGYSMYSLKSSGGSSKSGHILKVPFMHPACGCL